MDNKILCIASQFVDVEFIKEIKSNNDGLINDTYIIVLDDNSAVKKATLQKINKYVFKKPDEVMSNIFEVTNHLKNKVKTRNGQELREVLTVIKTKNDKLYYVDQEGEYWRAYVYVDDVYVCEQNSSKEDMYECAFAFGKFMSDLSDFPIDTLLDTIPHFHDTPVRINDLKNSVKNNLSNRLENVTDLVDFALAREEKAGEIDRMYKDGILKKRVTHNDTKINNILVDNNTKKGLCVIDLDTLMPGFAAYDFGDMVRFCATTAAEDEANLDIVHFDIEKYKIIATGYMDAVKDCIDENEAISLCLGAITITYEIGCRFLADYIDGDLYFKTKYPEHNLVRAKNQFKLVKEMEKQFDEMKKIIVNLL